jgi:gamma-glutamyltranspeptidase / glutathione hydrolase
MTPRIGGIQMNAVVKDILSMLEPISVGDRRKSQKLRRSESLQFRILAVCLLALLIASSARAEIAGTNGAVATVHPLATDAAIEAIKRGGNAVDAAVAAALTLGVVDGHNSGIGGGCFFLLRTARGSMVAIDGRETAPARATRDMFLRNGKADPELSQTGALAVGIPGSLAVYDYALRHFGKLKLRDVLLPAAALARNGFPLDATYARRLADTAEELARFDEARRIFLQPNGQPYLSGQLLRQPDLARSYAAIAEQGIDWFYKGDFPARAERWMRENAGLVTAEDFRKYEIKLREPIRTRYRDYEIVGFPPPSSGGAHVAQILNILSHFDFAKYPPSSAESIHLVAEAMKLAFADRAYWLGDPDFVSVPRGLISKQYAGTLAGRIDSKRAISVERHGPADEFGTAHFEKHTTHFSVADAEGNWIACTTTINTSFGSKVVIPGTGILLNNQMDDFSAQPGLPNFFGLIGAEANAVAPGKRPLSSMSPTIVLRNGKPVLSLGAAGGPAIISQTVINLINIIDYGMTIREALASPRIHHQWKPDELKVESLPAKVLEDLAVRGHKVKVVKGAGAAQIVSQSGKGFEAAHDPRLEGKAATW